MKSPATRRNRIATLVGLSLILLGVVLYVHPPLLSDEDKIINAAVQYGSTRNFSTDRIRTVNKYFLIMGNPWSQEKEHWRSLNGTLMRRLKCFSTWPRNAAQCTTFDDYGICFDESTQSEARAIFIERVERESEGEAIVTMSKYLGDMGYEQYRYHLKYTNSRWQVEKVTPGVMS